MPEGVIMLDSAFILPGKKPGFSRALARLVARNPASVAKMAMAVGAVPVAVAV